MSVRRADGFSLVEMVVATLMLMAVTAAVFSTISPAQGGFTAQTDVADLQQRLRVAHDTLFKELTNVAAPNLPLRTYYLNAATKQLMHDDGSGGPDVPVVDHVVALTFTYYGNLPGGSCTVATGARANPLVQLTAAELADGPWCPDANDASRWDADLLRIRRVLVTVRVEAAITNRVPDQEIRFEVSPRNLNPGR